MQVYEATFIMMIDRQRDAVKLKKTVLNTVWPRAIIGLLVWQEVSRVFKERVLPYLGRLTLFKAVAGLFKHQIQVFSSSLSAT